MSDDMRGDIAAAWAKVTNKTGKKRDVRKLPEYLNGGETVLAMTGGIIAGNSGLLVATDRRALFVSEGIINHSFEDFPYDRITTVTSTRGLLTGKIIVSTAGVSRVVQQVNSGEAEAVAAVLRERVEATTRQRYAPPPPTPYQQHYTPPPNNVDPSQNRSALEQNRNTTSDQRASAGLSIAAELRELADLRDRGVLTTEEFEGQKARLLRG